MSNHINFIRKAAALPVMRIKNDIHRYMEAVQNAEEHTSKRGYGDIVGLRAENYSVKGNIKLYRRVFVESDDSGDYKNVGWIVVSDADSCMVCGTSFANVSGGKHHCRACGNVVCENCSTGRELVDLIEPLGKVRVCSLCYYGQCPVEAVQNINSGRVVIGNFSEESEHDNDHGQVDPINLWEFGKVELHELTPGIVIKTRRPNRKVVYVNICSCPAVPNNSKAFDNETNPFCLVVGEIGATLNDSVVYDVAVHPTVIEMAKKSKEVFSRLCEQALVALSLLRGEKDFQSYQVETNPTSPTGAGNSRASFIAGSHKDILAEHYVRRRMQSKERAAASSSSASSSAQPADDAGQGLCPTKTLAIPSKLAFSQLYQLATKITDATLPAPITLNGQTAKAREEEIHHLAEHHTERIVAKLLCRTISQMRRWSVQGDSPGEEKEDDASHGHHRKGGDGSLLPTIFEGRKNGNGLPPRPGKTRENSNGSTNSGKNASRENWKTIVLSPNPGFVIKTWKADEADTKVFINVLHNELIDSLLDSEGFVLPEDLLPFCAFADPTSAEDKEGHSVPVYPVIVGSSYFVEAYITSEKKITDDERIKRIIEGVNQKFDAGLDPTDFVIPRVKGGFKGTWVDHVSFQYKMPPHQYIVARRSSFMRRSPQDDALQSRLSEVIFGSGGGGHLRSSFSETESVASELTVGSSASTASRRKSVAEVFFAPFVSSKQQSEHTLTPEMFLFKPAESLDWQDVVALKHYSIENPQALLGFQITRTLPRGLSETAVITGLRKNAMSKTEYRLSQLDKGDVWCKLKRGEKKSGYPFRPNRKVLFLDEHALVDPSK